MFRRNQNTFKETVRGDAADSRFKNRPDPSLRNELCPPGEEITPPPEEYSPGRDPDYRYEKREGNLMKKGKLLCLLLLTVIVAGQLRQEASPSQPVRESSPETVEETIPVTVPVQVATAAYETDSAAYETAAATLPTETMSDPETSSEEESSTESGSSASSSYGAGRTSEAKNSTAQTAAASQAAAPSLQISPTQPPAQLMTMPEFIGDGVKDPDQAEGSSDPSSGSDPSDDNTSSNPSDKITGNEGHDPIDPFGEGDGYTDDEEEETGEDEEGYSDGPGPDDGNTVIWVSPGESLPSNYNHYNKYNFNN